jgi:hypothetical protein
VNEILGHYEHEGAPDGDDGVEVEEDRLAHEAPPSCSGATAPKVSVTSASS